MGLSCHVGLANLSDHSNRRPIDSIGRLNGGVVLGIELDVGTVGDVDPDVNVRRTAEVPNEGWSFQAPVVPDAILTDVGVSKE